MAIQIDARRRLACICILAAWLVACGHESPRRDSDGAAGLDGNGGQGGGIVDGKVALRDASGSDGPMSGPQPGPKPPVDCTTQNPHCVSVAGTRNGESLAFSCRTLMFGEGKRGNQWAINCYDEIQDLAFKLWFPVPTASFNHLVPPGVSGLEFSFSSYNLATSARKGEMEETSKNLIRGSVTGSIDAQQVITGSFHGEWGPPAVGCKSDFGSYPCAEGVVNASFRVKSF